MNESWVCVDGHGDERVFPCEPYKNFPNLPLDINWGSRWTTGSIDREYRMGVLLPKGTIKHLIGRELSYSDDPVKLKIE